MYGTGTATETQLGRVSYPPPRNRIIIIIIRVLLCESRGPFPWCEGARRSRVYAGQAGVCVGDTRTYVVPVLMAWPHLWACVCHSDGCNNGAAIAIAANAAITTSRSAPQYAVFASAASENNRHVGEVIVVRALPFSLCGMEPPPK